MGGWGVLGGMVTSTFEGGGGVKVFFNTYSQLFYYDNVMFYLLKKNMTPNNTLN